MAEEDKSEKASSDALNVNASDCKGDKIAAAAALGALTENVDLSDTDRRQAHDILGTLSLDAEEKVRAAVARAIADYPFLPPALAEQIARDVSEVSAPVLHKSTALTDSFLAELIESGTADEQAQMNIATRWQLPETVSGPLLKVGRRRAVETVLSNETASINEEGYSSLFAREDLDGRMLTLVAARKDLSTSVVAQCHKIILTDRFDREFGARVRTSLIEAHALPPQMADAIVNAALEDALSRAAAGVGATALEHIELAESLHRHNDLTPSLLLRMTCDGSLDFTTAAFHVLSRRPYAEIERAFQEAGTEAFAELYLQTGLAPYFRFALVTAIKRIAKERAKPYVSAPDKPVQDIIREIVGFYRGIAPTSLDQVIARLCHEASRWSEDNDTASSSA
jgi:uncharacterized protein (DUF2336 family)